MNITSVTNTELIKIVSGQNNIFILDDYKNIRNAGDINEYRDTLELSQEYQNRYDVSNMSSLLSYTPTSNLKVKSNEELAEYIGGIGKRIDEAFGQGIFTKDEYDQLNEELSKYTERAIITNESKRAWREESSKYTSFGSAPTIKEIMDEMQKKSSDNYDNYGKYRTDRNLIWELINKFRYGTMPEYL